MSNHEGNIKIIESIVKEIGEEEFKKGLDRILSRKNFSKAEQACIDIYNDFDNTEIDREPNSVLNAYFIGEKLTNNSKVSNVKLTGKLNNEHKL